MDARIGSRKDREISNRDIASTGLKSINNMPLSEDPQINQTAGKLVKTLQGAFGTPPEYRPGKTCTHLILILTQAAID